MRTGFGIDAGEVVCNRLRGDGDTVDHELRDDDRAARYDHLGTVSQGDDQVGPADGDILQRHAGRQDHYTIGVGLQDSRSRRIACASFLKLVRACFETVFRSVFQIKFAAIAAFEIYHLTVLVSWNRTPVPTANPDA